MKKLLLLLLCLPMIVFGQNWVDMMQDPNVNFYETQRAFNNFWENKDIEKGKGWKQFKRWENFMEPRVYPDGIIQTKRLYEEYLNLARENSNFRLLPPNIWTQVGPDDVPLEGSGRKRGIGRLNTIVFHPYNPDILYVGAPAGGFWKSDDAGQNWTTSTDFLTNVGVSDIAIHPNNPDTLFVITGDRDAGDTYSYGVMKSFDGGNSWQTTGLSFNITSLYRGNRILIDPINPNVLVVATSNGVYRSTDLGDNFTLTFSSANLVSMEFHPLNSDIIYAGSKGSTSVYKSIDNGITWQQSGTGLPISSDVSRACIAVTNDNSNVVYALFGNNDNGFYALYKSSDEGNTWSQQSNSPNLLGWSTNGSDTGGQAWYDLALTVSPLDENIVFVGGVNCWKSNDSGVNWTLNTHWYGGGGANYMHADEHMLQYNTLDNKVYSANDGGLYVSVDNGNNWTDISDGLQITQFYKLGVSQTVQNLVIGGTQDNGTFLKDQNNWDAVIGGDGMECIIDYTDENIMYGSVYYGDIRKSTNGGNSFSSIAPSNNGAWVTPYILDKTDPNTIYIGYDELYKSNDGGASWSIITNGETSGGRIDQIDISKSNSNIILFSDNSSLYKTDDGGLSWLDISSLLPNKSITGIAIHPTDPNRLWLSFSGYSTNEKVYFSDDGGSTWTNISGTLPNIPTNCIIINELDSLETIYLGTDLGVFTKDSTSLNWNNLNSGTLPNVIVSELEIQYSSNKLFAATFGRGLWSFDLQITTPPIANFSVDDSVFCSVPATVNFTNNSFYSTSYFWDFGDGNTSTAINPSHNYLNYGNYSVSLIATGPLGVDTIVYPSLININSSNSCIVTLPNSGQGNTQTSCNGTLYDVGGPNGNYYDNCDSWITIEPLGANQVTLNFLDFDIEAPSGGLSYCNWDYLEIFDGNSTSSPSIGQYCNTLTGSPGTITSTGGAITILLHADQSVNGRGFEVDWSCSYPINQITFTTSQASEPRNSIGTTPDDGQAIAVTDTIGMGGNYDWVWTDLNTGNIVQTTLQTPNISDTLNAASGTYLLECTNANFFYTAKDTVTITAPGTNFSIGSDNGSLILCQGADSVNLTVLELCQYPFTGGSCGYINQVLGTEFNFYDANTNVLVYSTTVLNNIVPIQLPIQPLGNWRIISLNYDNGAVGDTTFTVSADTLDLNVSSTNISNSFPLGTITVNATGGDGNYSLCLVSPGFPNCLNQGGWPANPTLSVLNTGMYYFTVTSGDGCFAEDSVLIQNICDGQITSNTYNPCDSVVLISAEINMAGSGPFSYEFSLYNGMNLIEQQNTTIDSITFNNQVSSGTYSVTILETNTGCLITDFVTFNLNPVIVSANVSQLTAPGATDGSLFLSVDSGLAPFTYIWEVNGISDTSSNSNGIFTKFNLDANTYCLTIIDANGCIFYDCYEIKYYPCFANLSIQDSIFCNGLTGSLLANIDTSGYGQSGGPYTYSLYNAINGSLVTSFNSPALSQSFPNLSSGVYYLEVFDQAYGDVCDPDTIILFEPDPISISSSIFNPSSFLSNDGSAVVNPTGGTPPYSYSWSNGSTTANISGLGVGFYTCVVIDANGCLDFLTISLFSNPNSNNNIILSNDTVVCNSFNDTLYALSAIQSSLQVDDIHDIVMPLGFTFNFYGLSYTNCVVSSNGYVTFDTSLATSYSPYAINTPLPNPGAVPENAILAPWQDINPGINGNIYYELQGNAPNRKFIITFCQIGMFSCNDSLTTTQVVLHEGTDKIEMFINSKPLCFSWNGGYAIQGLVDIGNTTADIVFDPILSAYRNYPLQWSAYNEGWEFIPNGSNYIINSVPYIPIVAGLNIWTNSNGTILGYGAELPVNIFSTDTYFANYIGDCAPVSYDSVTITVNNCYNNPGIVQIDSLSITSDIDCYGDFANIEVYVDNDTNSLGFFGPLVPYQLKVFKPGSFVTAPYLSSSVTTGSTITVNGITEGFYYALVVDSLAFVSAFPAPFFSNSQFLTTVLSHPSVYDYDTITIIEPQELSNSLSTQSTNQCFGDCNASELISFSGGTLPYIIDGVSISGSDTLFDNLCGSQSGLTYTYTASDANGCSPSSSSPTSFVITEPDPLTPAGSISSNFNGQDISCFGASDGEITAAVSSGAAPYQYSIDNNIWTSNPVFSGLSSGTYTIYYRDANLCLNDETFTLIEADEILINSVTIINPSSNSSSDGSISIDSISGGTTPYFYYWSNGSTLPYATGLSAGAYTVDVTDDNGCINTFNYVLTFSSSYGCTDSLALNYDSLATIDDSSCVYYTCTEPAPTNVFSSDIVDTKATVNWDNMNSSDCMVFKYVIRFREFGTNSWTTKSGGIGNGLCNFGLNNTSKTLRNLTPSTTYQYKIKAFYCNGGSSGWTLPKYFTTSGNCPEMTNLSAQTYPLNTGKVTFSWDTTGYYVFARVALRENNSGAPWQTAGGFGVYYPTLSVNKFGLLSGVDYRAQGRTFCDSNITSYRSWWTPPIFWTQPTIRLSGGSLISNLDVYPNPSKDVFNISFNSDEIQDLTIRILNVMGAEVYREDKQEFVGEYIKQVSLGYYGKGIYFLEIQTGDDIINKKIILK